MSASYDTHTRLDGFVSVAEGIPHVSGDTVAALERGLAAAGVPRLRSPVRNRVFKRLLRFIADAGLLVPPGRAAPGRPAVIVPLMGKQDAFLFPWLYTRSIVPYIWDCIPAEYGKWATMFERLDIRCAAFSARTPAQHFAQLMPDRHFLWVPEAVELAPFDPSRPLHLRSTDVLEFGRRYGKFHAAVRDALATRSFRHRYERKPGEIIFPTRADFVAGLADAKITICFPQSLTHPERFGNVETVTARFFESMASGCIIIGEAPAELVDLFGYDPVVPVDWTDPAGHICAMLDNIDSYAELTRRNLATMGAKGNWQGRMQTWLGELERLGYEVGPARRGQGPGAAAG